MIRRTIFLLTLLTIALQIYGANPRRYITQNGSGLRDGSSWENAGSAEDLQDILNTIENADFWIAKGIYKPNRYFTDPEDNRNMTISAHHNFIYGGFAGNETDLSQRDIRSNETIFSGDIGIEGDNSDNSFHVMRAVQILDGVTICYGNANGQSDPDHYGGGVYVWGSNSIFRNCTFRDNYASSRGGAVLMDTWGYDVTFENCLFYNNEATYGGAIYSRYDLSTINNCTFVNNTAENGGGIYIVVTDESKFLITNNIFWQNSVNHIRIYNSANFSYTVSHNAIEGGYGGFANINLSSENAGDGYSPYFTDPDNHDYSLQWLSPCINSGVYWNATCNTDITGKQRPQGTGWDIGAYEYSSGPLTAFPPTVSTLSPEFTTVSTARIRGNVTDDGSSQMITKGVYYSTSPGFDPVDSTLIKYDQLYNEGEFHIDITNLLPGTTYFYRIFCENRVGTAIGAEMSFTTKSGISPDVNGILYAKPDGTGDGSSWANALHGNDLQLGINHTDVKEIWLAEGKYVPTSWPCTQLKGADFEITDDFAYKLQEDSVNAKGITEFKMNGTTEREKHFMLRANLSIYGGFTGTETAVEQRDFRTNKTILSGDIGAEGEYYDNAFHVIYHYYNPDVDSTTVLDGVTISDGNANGTIMGDSPFGGGLFSRTSSPTIRNCVFENNLALYGGGIMNGYSQHEGRSEPKIYNTIITQNSADEGGGIYNNGAAPYLSNCVITNNEASSSGGGIYHFGEGYIEFDVYSYTDIIHSTIAGNFAPEGEEIKLNTDYYNRLTLYNSIVWGSSVTGTTYYNYSYFSALSGNNLKGEGNIILSENNTGDINSPYFNDPENNDYSLRINSACKDMGMYKYKTGTDITGTLRPQGAAYDIGAHEFITAEAAASSPTLETSYADSLRTSYAVCHVNVISDGGSPLWERGVVVSDSSGFDPENQGERFFKKSNYSEPDYSVEIYGLKPGFTYYYKAYSENRMGCSFGEEMNFTTNEVIPDGNGIVYVSTEGAGNGSSWENALNGNDLQAAIDYEESDQIWVAKGKYLPTEWPAAINYPGLFSNPFNEREKHFALRDSIEVYGGFGGWESDIAERDIKYNETILSGDIGIEGDNTDNCLHVVVNLPYPDSIDILTESSPIVFDGFTISDGYYESIDGHHLLSGAGMYNKNLPLIRNCIFRNNRGGAVSYDEIDTFRFTYTIKNTVFDSNTNETGGAAFNVYMTNTDFNFYSCVFINNTSTSDHGGSGSIYINGGHFTISNSLFYNNRGLNFSVLYNEPFFLYTDDIRKITNSSFINNVSENNESIIYSNTLLDVANCIFYKNNCNGFYDSFPEILNISYCAFEENINQPDHSGSDNIILSSNNAGDPNSPYFSDPDRNHWWIQEASPLRNAGIWTDDVPLYDIVGNLRDDYPDIGCYEYDPSSIEDSESLVPLTTKLYQNYPNPFNPATNIKFSIAKAGEVELTVYNVLGQIVTKLVESDFKAGNHSVVFNADAINSGVYYYTLEVDGKKLTKRMLMVK